MYDNVGHHSLGVFPQAALDAWQCDICCSKSGRGFEATFEVLPRLNEINFSSGVIDELLYLDLPRECRFPSGIMMLEYVKAVQESVYEQLRVVREGQLRILFTPDLKILSWEFCARRHEELLSRRLFAPQVNQLLQVAQKCQSTISESGADGVSQPDLKSNSVLVVTAGRQLARSLELQSLNDLGFSKRYVADVVNSMKDLMDFCREHKKGPIEALKNFPRRATAPKIEMDQTGLNNLMSLNPGLNAQTNNNNLLVSGRGGALSGSSQAALPLSNYQNLLTRQNSLNSTNSPIQNESSSCVLPNGLLLQQNQSQPTGQALQQHMMQQYLQDMGKKNNGLALSGPRPGGPGFGNSPANSAVGSGPCVVQSQQSTRSNSFKAGSSESESPAPVVLSQKGSDLPQSRYLSDEMVLDIAGEFTDDGFFDNDFRFD
ncbi:probable transcriptional regulator slk2 [Phtheirospermum japonicum]|uniref:Probable transcriptional regulator slk2 n=1 Tax=Phtheirospermum japonicum TaxID=374723 RepID=A0A830BS00_9LAMI|nr:probable transcriptional regulator slk2 [Phtheirospermum japonicum]